jgi:hypothetical protein
MGRLRSSDSRAALFDFSNFKPVLHTGISKLLHELQFGGACAAFGKPERGTNQVTMLALYHHTNAKTMLNVSH